MGRSIESLQEILDTLLQPSYKIEDTPVYHIARNYELLEEGLIYNVSITHDLGDPEELSLVIRWMSRPQEAGTLRLSFYSQINPEKDEITNVSIVCFHNFSEGGWASLGYDPLGSDQDVMNLHLQSVIVRDANNNIQRIEQWSPGASLTQFGIPDGQYPEAVDIGEVLNYYCSDKVTAEQIHQYPLGPFDITDFQPTPRLIFEG